MDRREKISFQFDILIPLIIITVLYAICFFISYKITNDHMHYFEFQGLTDGDAFNKGFSAILILQIPTFLIFGTAVVFFHRGLLSAFLAFLINPIVIIIGVGFFLYQIIKRIVLTFRYIKQSRRDRLLEKARSESPDPRFNSISLEEYLDKNNMTIEDLHDSKD